MNGRLKIGDSGYNVTQVLELISKGRSYGQILGQLPGITRGDIRQAARIAHDFIIKHQVIDTLLEINVAPISLPQAQAGPQKWSAGEKREMIQLHRSGAATNDIARILRRPKIDIEHQLIHSGLISRTNERKEKS